MNLLKAKLDDANYKKLENLGNAAVMQFVARYVEHCNPAKVYVTTDSAEDIAYVRNKALEYKEEKALATKGHTIHFDNYKDQGRDKANTGVLVSKGENLGKLIETLDRDSSLTKVQQILKNIMAGKELFVRFFCLGPNKSVFSIPCLQLTDSAYVAHSEDLLYRHGYEEFRRRGDTADFFKFVHSQGELLPNNTCKNLQDRRILVDLKENTVYSTNTQYGGNTLGLKKLAMRLAIAKGDKEGWLTEHMLVMGVNGPKQRKTYFLGAFPSLCGKTSTAMMIGESIVGDDIAYLRKIDGTVRAVNVEAGMFGIIQGINSQDDPTIWKALHSERELIFSNILYTDELVPHWIGKDGELPEKGYHHSGEWTKGKKDEKGNEIPVSHPNARFTLSLNYLDNLDKNLHNPAGVEVGAIVYGGRDSDTWVPVEEALSWNDGIICKGGSLESETTAATLGAEGKREFNAMSNMDFLPIPVGKYIQNNLDFAKGLQNPPKIFGVNYFLKDKSGNFYNGRQDKRVWYKWMERRVHGEVETLTTPTGRIPKYEDLKALFKEVLDKDYTKADYLAQFTVRIPEQLAKIDRIKAKYQQDVPDAPATLFKLLDAQKKRLDDLRAKHGDNVTPDKL